MRKLLQIFIAIIPLVVSFSTSDPTLAIRFLLLALVVSGVLFYYLFENRSINREVVMHPAMLAFGIMILFYLLSASYNGFGSESIYVILKLFLSYFFAIILIQFVVNEGYKPLLNSFVYLSLFLSAIYFSQIIANYSDIMNIKIEWQRKQEFNSIAATMGNKNLLSSLQFLMLPILIYRLTVGKRVLKIFSGLAILLILITFLQTHTRAVFVALFIFIITFLILNKKNIKLYYYVVLLILFTILISYSVSQHPSRLVRFKSQFSEILSDASIDSRYKLYKSTLQLIAEHPILGVGPGNWRIEIWRYGLYFDSLGKSFAQRPHNDFLWVFAEGGVFAGLSYMLLFLILLKDSYLLHKNRKEEYVTIYLLLFATVMGYGFISLVDFPMERFSHSIIFFVLAAIIIGGRLKQKCLNKEKLPVWVNYVFLFIACFSVYIASIRYQKEVHAANAIHYTSKGNWNYVIKAIDKAYNPIYYEMENSSTPLLWYRGVAYFNQKKYDLALEDFKGAYKVNPYHVHVLNNLATSYQLKGDSKNAKKYYGAVFDVNPTFKESRINLAAILYNEKNYVEALDVILKSKVDPYWKRKRINDNYDLYLKTIVNDWKDLVYVNANNDQKKTLDFLMISFDKKPNYAGKKLKSIFDIRQNKDVDYLTALMLFEGKHI